MNTATIAFRKKKPDCFGNPTFCVSTNIFTSIKDAPPKRRNDDW